MEARVMKDISDAPTKEEAMRRTLANISQFDLNAFAMWLRGRAPAVIRLARHYPPNRIYKLSTGSYVLVEGYYEKHLGVRFIEPGAPGLDVTPSMLEDATDEVRSLLTTRELE